MDSVQSVCDFEESADGRGRRCSVRGDTLYTVDGVYCVEQRPVERKREKELSSAHRPRRSTSCTRRKMYVTRGRRRLPGGAGVGVGGTRPRPHSREARMNETSERDSLLKEST